MFGEASTRAADLHRRGSVPRYWLRQRLIACVSFSFSLVADLAARGGSLRPLTRYNAGPLVPFPFSFRWTHPMFQIVALIVSASAARISLR
ncbi:hypothetical protein LJ655_07560 [Paraburkholderia sp. MMS20-SJTN17]|uniref:Uncharacterized protein n=1 Tax=Paraburkholderia translucens TaxID=2886945 RepID=A0ABS8KAH8_9BURK|nr:hypothetical protein [Paraburkholderia sp. MMS20-SJTN17]MCC8401751.1 hypothetical protein [Paraburkholderia sp. MMS20-SJTN17]